MTEHKPAIHRAKLEPPSTWGEFRRWASSTFLPWVAMAWLFRLLLAVVLAGLVLLALTFSGCADSCSLSGDAGHGPQGGK